MAVVFGLLCACSFTPGTLYPIDSGSGSDGRMDMMNNIMVDMMIDTPTNTLCYGPPSGAFRICLASAPTTPFSVSGGFVNYNTTQCNGGVMVTPTGGPELCVIAATSINIDSQLNVSGSRPLVLLSTMSVSISGSITVAAGADPTLCNASTPGGAAQSGASGGGGGSFGTRGGNGGSGDGGNGAAGAAGLVATQPVAVLRGGCSGAAGGTQSTIGDAGNAGLAGGALYILGSTIAISSNIDASGRGGGGGPTQNGGGGGGGSGGMIALYATTIAVSGRVVANGGAGGEGADTNDVGSTGLSPNPFTPTIVATCPNGPSSGGIGGSGAAGTSSATAGASSGDGGGGGGGGHGVIRILSGQTQAMTGGTFSPTPN